MQAYLEKIRNYADRLAAADAPVAEADLVIYTLYGLPDEYAQFKTSIRTKPACLPIKMSELSALLNSEEIHLASAQQYQPDPSTALAASRS